MGNISKMINLPAWKAGVLTLFETNKNMPAVKAALGWEGFMEGIDYRGIPVAAAVCAVPDSPWRLVARMDLSEIYLPLRERLWMLGGLTGLMLIGAAAGVGMIWHRRNMEFFRDRFETTEALRRSEEQYHRILDTMMEGFQIVGYDWRYLYINDAAAGYGRRKKEDMLGHSVTEIYPGFERTSMFAGLRRCMEERASQHIEEEFTFPDNATAWFELIIQPVPEGISILSMDITERKLAERYIEHLNRVLRAIRNVNRLIVKERNRGQLIQDAGDMLVKDRGYISCLIVLTDGNGKPDIYAAAGMDELSFKLIAEILDRGDFPPCCEGVRKSTGIFLVSDRDAVCGLCPISRSCAGTDAMGIGLIHEKASFGYLVTAVEQGVRADAEEQGLFTEMAGDLAYALHTMMVQKNMEKSEQKRKTAEDQLLQAQKMEAVGRLAGGVAHDFNNNLQAILGYSDILISKLESGHPFSGYLDEIQNAALRSAALTRQLLAFARKQTITPEILDLNDTVESMLKMLRRLIGENIDLLWKPAKNLWPVKMDPSQVDQLLANLVVNARDAIDGVGKVTIETGMTDFDEDYCVTHIGFIPGRYVLMAVSDNGTGMDRETQSHIFEPFFTTKPSGKGTGLGLSTVYGIAKQNNGFINVYSEPGQGTTFRIYLPPNLSEPATTDAIPEALELPTGEETILLVEDDLSLLDLCRIQLTNLGYHVIFAETPERALRLAEEYSGEIQLLMTDVIMPEMSGRDLRERIHALRPEIKCLFMSGYTADVITHHGVLEEGIHFLQKPFSRNTLAKKIREVLEI
jgi:two-component system, cell cycle sensor histidine kinase and response regulator CckA